MIVEGSFSAQKQMDNLEQNGTSMSKHELGELVSDQLAEIGELEEIEFEGINEKQAAYEAAVSEKTIKHEREAEKQRNLDMIILNASSQIRNKISAMGWHEKIVEDVISMFVKKVRIISKLNDLPPVQQGVDFLYEKMTKEIEKREAENATTH